MLGGRLIRKITNKKYKMRETWHQMGCKKALICSVSCTQKVAAPCLTWAGIMTPDPAFLHVCIDHKVSPWMA